MMQKNLKLVKNSPNESGKIQFLQVILGNFLAFQENSLKKSYVVFYKYYTGNGQNQPFATFKKKLAV